MLQAVNVEHDLELHHFVIKFQFFKFYLINIIDQRHDHFEICCLVIVGT